MNNNEERLARLTAKLCEGQRTNSIAADRIEELVARNAQLEDLVRAVAHIGVDFGHGEFDLNDSHIRKARELIEPGE